MLITPEIAKDRELLPELLRLYMRDNKVSQVELANRLCVSEASISLYLKGRRPRKNVLDRISSLLTNEISSLDVEKIDDIKSHIKRVIKMYKHTFTTDEKFNLIRIIVS